MSRNLASIPTFGSKPHRLRTGALCLLFPAALACSQTSPLNPPRPSPQTTEAAPQQFTELSPEQTGVQFRNAYDDPEMWGRLYREFTLGSVGTGVTTGDFDRDGKPDIYAVSKTGPNKLFRQTGDLRFEDVTEQAGVAGLTDHWATGATFVDINNDGWLDLYLCQFNAPNQLYINQQDGTFSEQAAAYGLDVSDASVMAAFADADRDGDLDLYLVTNILDYAQNFKGRPDYFFINENGSFRDATTQSGIEGVSQGHSATWWDYNQDGWPDVYVANDFEKPDRLYRNNGDGSFTDVLPDTFPHTPYFSMGSDLGDVTNDGLVDFFVSDMAATSHEKDKTGMAEMGRGIWENERVDSLFPMYMRNAFYLNTGTERFNEIAYMNQLDASDWTWAVKFADLDNDGWNDLFITNGNIRNFMEADLLDKQNVAFNLAARIRVYKNAPPLEEKNLAFRNEGDLRFTNVSADWGLDHLGISFGASYSDLDRDGDLDLVVNNFEDNLKIYRNNSTNNGLLIRLQGVSSNQYGLGSTLYLESSAGTQTRQLTLARGVLSSDEPLVHFGLGADPAAKSLTVKWPSGHTQVLQNLAAGKLYTIAEPAGEAARPLVQSSARNYRQNAQLEEVSASLGLEYEHAESYFNELTQQLLLPRRLSKQGPALAWGDIDGDGSDELFIGGAAGKKSRVYTYRDGAFTPHPREAQYANEPGETLGIAILDDFLYTANGGVEGAYQDLIYPVGTERSDTSTNASENNSDLVSRSQTSPISTSTATVCAADFDGDGDLDLFVAGRSVPGAYPERADSYLLENRDGKLVDVTAEKAPMLRKIGMVTSAIFSDANSDGRPDLLLAREWSHVTLLENAANGFVDRSEAAGFTPYLGWWNSIAPADLNGDGKIDYVVGNAGLNTKYLASAERPTQLYYGIFDDSGKSQIVEAQYEDGDDKLYPIRPYSKLRYAFPSLEDKFPSFQSFADSTLEEVFSPEILASVQRYDANTLASGVFLSQADGSFAFRPLPRLAQTAPIYGIAAQDFDGDGHTDLYVLQNSFSPEPTTGRFNGGLSLLLLGDGAGGFTPAQTADSGLVVRGDAKALLVTDLDENGWADFLVAQNGDKLLAFRNRGVEGRHAFAVKLEGPEGNRNAYGAKVTVHRADGSQSHAELTSHAGYLSQSPAKLFFGYTDTNKPVEFQITWPDGQQTRHPFTPNTPAVVLKR